MAEEEYVDTSADAMTEGGRLDDIDATIIKARWEIFNYQGKSTPSTGLRLYVEFEDGSKGDEFLRCANPDTLIPNEDGTRLKRAPGKTSATLGARTKAGRFLKSVENAGFDKSVGGPIDVLDGLRAHFIQEKRKKGENSDPNEKDVYDTLVSKIHEGAGESASPGQKRTIVKKKGGGSSKGFDAKGAATELVMAIVKDAGEDGAERGSIGQKVFRRAGKDPELKPHAKEISQAADTDEFLEDDDAPFIFDVENGMIYHPDFVETE